METGIINVQDFIKDIAFYAGITMALVQIIKNAAEKAIPDRFTPLLSFTLGSIIGLTLAHWPMLLSLLIGLVASGSYDLGKQTAKGVAERIEEMKK